MAVHISKVYKGQVLNHIFDSSNQPEWDNISSGFVGTIHLLHPDPQFEGRTRMKITNLEAFESCRSRYATGN